ncbi:MAG: 2,3-bisphosphoglycerate-independent phosphoglycerate mutase [Candidatus Omnitrophica bacterium]|nr:2,3-bisphosphoglycerate-independent phosphoglycerate mutase [Candidatus Omnitrophota bacterium]MCF7879007.1 2,3-bisphosphoglycerate-independent phosphoglycerate mutase [Candidatus Omnitrophota bacterium]MCF7888153.1 2,3-bisphosphoglycerate-independent phosphoglycerate mutase [Candidatus Omnitrophota bacterium]
MDIEMIQKLKKPADTKIVLLVMDGLGGLPAEEGLTELEKANTPNLDKLAKKGICGLHQPIAAGITPGSGPAHLSLFGYNPIKYQVGRGVLAALGINFALQNGDVAARGNFCTVDKQGKVSDRRAGRISTEKNKELCRLLSEIKLDGAEVFVETVKEHRFLLVLRGKDLSADIADTDPQVTGELPHPPRSLSGESNKTTKLLEEFLDKAKKILADQHPANMALLRGFSKHPSWPSMQEAFGLKSAAIAGYPMYKGIAKLLGMDVLKTGETLASEVDSLENNFDNYDFFYFHVKKTDSYGEDGNFKDKVKVIEETDSLIPRILKLNPEVVLVTGDHSTPFSLASHSWHPVPTLLWSKYCRSDRVEKFGERDCLGGALGPRIAAVDLIPLALANALRLEKFGA